MKHLFKNPHKKGKNYICNSEEKIYVELNEVKIKNLRKLNDNNGYYIECIIPNKNNKEALELIDTIDNDAKECLINNYNEWFNNDDTPELLNEYYIKSLIDNDITIILSNKIDSEIIIDNNDKDINELISFLNSNKKNKNLIINISVVFLGIYINSNTIINKWAIKNINIESLLDNDYEWNREEIEEEWKDDLIIYEEEINKKIIKLTESLNNAKKL
jgi:hypothetical protein